MSAQTFNPVITLLAAAITGIYVRVKIDAAGKAAIAGAADVTVGITQAPAGAIGDPVAVKCLNGIGTSLAVVDGSGSAIAIGDTLEQAASGVLVKKAAGTVVAVAMEATTLAGYPITVITV